MLNCVAIKLKSFSQVQYFLNNSDIELAENDYVVVGTANGKELGQVVNKSILVHQTDLEAANVLERVAEQKDIDKDKENQKLAATVLKDTSKLVNVLKLNMSLVEAYVTLDAQKVIISFVCDDRVDFRELVKQLANNFKIKIELKQIGIRDKAKTIGGIGSCGQECCCSRYLNDFDKVSIKMAKTQNLSLNPAKISGICGRLMCCLSYENDHYSITQGKMPRLNSKVTTPQGEGVVLYNNLIKELCTVKVGIDDYKIAEYKLSELKFNETGQKPCFVKTEEVVE